ncbi:MAG: sulfatase [Geminicoccaceae bacterium]
MRIFSSFLFLSILIFPALFCSLPSALARPNFVLVLTDDMEVAPVGYMYRTKSLIRAQGAEFQRAYAASPLCAPARATILTGRYPQNTGVRRNSHKAYYEQGNPARSLPVWLHGAGYRTALIGKYMNGYPAPDTLPYIPPGWDVWSVRHRAQPDYDGQYNYWLNENGKSVYYGNRPEHYATDVYRKKAVAFIRETVTQDAPFFLELAVHAPHTPFVPARRHASQFPTARAPRPASFNEADVSDKPAYIRDLRRLDPAAVATIDAGFRNRLRMLKAVDEAIKAIVDALATAGQLDNTYILFASDHGWAMGPHRIPGAKAAPYEEVVRVPLFIRGPGIAAGLKLDHLVSSADIAPTILELAGIPVPAEIDGRSLVPLLGTGRPAPDMWRQTLGIGFQEGDDAFHVPTWQGIRTRRYTYVEYPGTGERELYDNLLDPHQTANIAVTADQALIARFSERSRLLAACAQTTCREAEDLPLP